jgi:hypothetical protein
MMRFTSGEECRVGANGIDGKWRRWIPGKWLVGSGLGDENIFELVVNGILGKEKKKRISKADYFGGGSDPTALKRLNGLQKQTRPHQGEPR